MPRFIENGPDIPEGLLSLHEEGRVVFFCGAGISYPAGLPGFGGLVNQLYKELRETPSAIEQAAIKMGQYDTAIGLQEQPSRIAGGREVVRRILAGILLRILDPQSHCHTRSAVDSRTATR